MKKVLVVALLTVATVAQAGDIFDKNQKWDMKSASNMSVTVRPVDNVQATCEQESKRRGNGGFGYGVQACTFWQGNECTIIVSKKETHHTLGHEFYHCFAKGFH